jgi:hypothetical protein
MYSSSSHQGAEINPRPKGWLLSTMKHPEHGFSLTMPIDFQAHVLQWVVEPEPSTAPEEGLSWGGIGDGGELIACSSRRWEEVVPMLELTSEW